MTDELRNVILNAHNDFRKKLVNGKVKDAKGNLPTGKNIYKFVLKINIQRKFLKLFLELQQK